TGTQVLTLYAQEGGEGAGIKVDANGYSNPIQIIVKESLVDLALQMQSAIRIYPEGERAPSESIPQGKKCIVKVSLYNKQSSAYRGVLCLKDLKKDDILFYFSPNPTKIVAKSARQIEGSFIPRTTGTYRYGLFYKEGNSWLPVQGQGGLSSEVSFTVGSISESHSYKLVGVSTPTVEKTEVRVDNLQIGTSYGVVCLIKNEGKNVFSGEICLRRVYDQKILQKKMVSKISSMHSEKVSFAFIPTEADYNKTTATQYEICSKLPTGNWQAIPNTRFSVDIVYKKEKGDYLLGVKIRKLIPDINELVPQKGDGKTTLFYTFRILDSKNVPVPDIRLEAKVSKKQPRGTWSQKDDTIFGFEIEEKESNIKSLVNDPVLQSTLSDADGYVTLAVPFETCISQTAVDHYCFCLGARTSENVEIKILENDFDRPFVLRKEVDILPLKSFKIKLENSFKDEKASKKGKFSIIPKFSASWDIEEGHFVNPSCSFGVEGSIGISDKISTSKKDNREIKKATATFSAGAEAGLEVALEGEVEMNQDLMLDAPLFFTEIVCRLASQLVNDIGGRWSSGLGNYLESYADDVAKVREQLDETTSDISASLKASTDIGGYVELNFLEKLMRKNQAPIFHNKSSIKAKAEYELTSKFHNSSIPSNSTQNISHQLKFMVQGENAFGYSNREMDKILKESYGGSFDMEIIGGYVWSNKYEKEYNNENFFAPTLQKVSSKCMIGPFAKVKTDINLFDYNSGGKLIILNGGISAEVSTECSNKGVVGGELLSYMSNMSMSYSKQTPLEANCLTVSHNPLEPEVVLDFMQREYDPSKLSSYRQTSSRDIQKDYCFTKQSKLDLDLSFYAKEFKIGNLSLIDKKSEKKLELPFSLELNFPKLSHSYYYAAGNRMITTDTTYFNPDTPQSIALVKDKVNKMYNKTIEVMQEGIAKATDWALEKGMALLTTAGDKTVEFVNRVRDYLGSLFRSAELRANPQTKVSHIRFVIPGEGKVFNNGTSYNFSYAYPAGEATGICKQDGDEFVIVSDIFFIRAIYNNQSLLQAPNGTFAVSPEIGVDDLSTLSLNPNSKVTLYYLPLNAKNNEWQRIGEAKGTYQCSGLGNYALGVSLQQDREAPVVTCFPDREHNSLLVEVEDNIGIRWSSLSIVVNGVARNYRKTSKHTQVLVPLAEGELAEGAIPTIVITVEDLARNKGSYEQYDPNILPVTEAAISGSLPICYPNPADTYLDVRLSDSWLGAAYYLYSFDGKLLKYGIVSETLQRLSLPEDTSEMCYIRFQMKDKTYTQAIIRIQ
ncbi:hypothetical protein, partial [Porphyromonas circumdentaria]|uniref:hypothetical protein n=1 Tax=Porphyromonas circumdentaria TaxID=29524 RepID=UPI0026DAF385